MFQSIRLLSSVVIKAFCTAKKIDFKGTSSFIEKQQVALNIE